MENSAKSISNRLILKQKIIDFKQGNLTFEELENINDEMYPIAIKDIDYLFDIARVIDGRCLYPFEHENCKRGFFNLKETDELPEPLEISLGYEIMNDVNQDLNKIFEKADQKMYKNKKK